MKKAVINVTAALCVAVGMLIVSSRTFLSHGQTIASSIGVEKPNTSPLSLEFSVDYQLREGGGAVGIDSCAGLFFCGTSFGWGEDSQYVKNISTWDAHLGLRYRLPIVKDVFYIEGRALAGYAHAEMSVVTGYKTTTTSYSWASYTTTSTTWEQQSGGNVFFALTPRAQIKIGVLSIFAGYRWDFAEFKFSKDYTTGYATLGLGLGF